MARAKIRELAAETFTFPVQLHLQQTRRPDALTCLRASDVDVVPGRDERKLMWTNSVNMQRLLENKTAVDSSTVLLIMCEYDGEQEGERGEQNMRGSIVGSSIGLGTEYCMCVCVCVCVCVCSLARHSVSKIVLLEHNEAHSTPEPPPVSRIVLYHSS